MANDVVPIDSVKNSLAIRAIIAIEEQHFLGCLAKVTIGRCFSTWLTYWWLAKPLTAKTTTITARALPTRLIKVTGFKATT